MAGPPKSSLRDLIAAGPGGGEEEEEPSKFLGVPEGYVSEQMRGIPEGGAPTLVAPRYTEADLYAPGGGDPVEQARLQQMLDNAGLFKKGEKYVLGRWDDATISAYGRLLKFANRQGYDAPTALKAMGTLSPEEYAETYGEEGGPRSGSTPKTPKPGAITQGNSIEDLRYLADRTARKSLGRKLAPDELERFTGAYQSMLAEANARQAGAQAQAAAGANVTYAGPTDPEAFATAELERLDPVAFGARKQLDAFKTISGMLGGIGGGT